MDTPHITDKTGKFQYKRNHDGTAAVVQYLEFASNLRIPENLDDLAVSSLLEYSIAHNECEIIHIPKTISRIEPAVFLSEGIKEVVVDKENPWFRTVDGLLIEATTNSIVFFPPEFPADKLRIPEGIRAIYNYAFSGCRHLKQLILPEGLESIGYGAFEHCGELTDLYIPSSVSYIGDWAFDNCQKLTLQVHEDVFKTIWGYFREFPDLNYELVEEKSNF